MRSTPTFTSGHMQQKMIGRTELTILPDDSELLDQLADLLNAKQNVDPLERSRRIALLSDQLRNCLREVDALGLSEAGVHLDMTLYAVEKAREPKRAATSPDRSRLH